MKYLLSCGLLIVIAHFTNAQKKNVPSGIYTTPKPASFQGTINGHKPTDSIRILFFRDYLIQLSTTQELELTNSSNFFIVPGKAGVFEFTLPDVDHVGKMLIYLYTGEKESIPLKEYLVEPGDSIQISITKTSSVFDISFKGSGDAKYNCLKLLNAQFRDFFSGLSNHVLPLLKTYSPEGFRNLYSVYKNHTDSALGIIEGYKQFLTSVTYQLLRAEVIAKAWWQWQLQFEVFFERATEVRKQVVTDMYFDFPVPADNVDPEIKSLSISYVAFILHKLKTSYSLKNNGSQIAMKSVYDIIEKSYTGLLKEKLISLLMLHPVLRNGIKGTEDDYYRCLKNAHASTRTTYLRMALQSQLAITKGNPAYSFSLPDTLGRITKLSDFKNKVIFQDIWFTGCTGCAQFHKMFTKDIYPYFKDSSQFEVVSICSDKTQETWRKSIQSNKYTSAGYVNLFTEGLADNHPIFRYYSIGSAPFIVIIGKNGKIFQKIDTYNLDMANVRAIINQALSEK